MILRKTSNFIFELWFIKSLVDIFSLHTKKEELLKLEWFKEKSVWNLLSSIEKARNQDGKNKETMMMSNLGVVA